MKQILFIGIGGIVLIVLFFGIRGAQEESPNPLYDDTSPDVEVPGATSTATTTNGQNGTATKDASIRTEVGVFPDQYIFTMRAPTGTDTRVENESIYRIIYAGPENEPPALTDGFGMSVELLKKSAEQSAEAFAVDRFTETRNVIEGSFAAHTAYGKNIFSLDVRSELGNMPVEHIYYAVDDTHIAFITISIHATSTEHKRYEGMITAMLGSVQFQQVSRDGEDRIEVTTPQPDETVATNTINVHGRARGNWYFEGTFPVVVTDWDGRIVGEGYATAEEEWMTESYVPFSGSVTVSLPETSRTYPRGTVIFHRSNPSGLPENDAALEIPIRFTL